MALRALRLASCLAAALCAPGPGAAPSPPGPTLSVSVIAHGGDPSGATDSAPALRAALAAAAALAAGAPSTVGSGDVLVDLGGGRYKLSSPVVADGVSGRPLLRGIVIAGGTLFADNAPGVFPADGFLLDFTYAQQITLKDLVLDAQHAGGCLRVDTILQSTIHNVFFLHYSTFGLKGDSVAGSSHELLVDSCTFAEFMWGEAGYDVRDLQAGVAILAQTTSAGAFYDSNFYNIIIRCTRLGVWDRAGANLWHGVHVYSTCDKSKNDLNVTVGMLSEAGQSRISNSYFDDSPLVLADTYGDATVSDNLVYGHAHLILAPQHADVNYAAGIVVRGNIFSQTDYATPTLYYDASNGTLVPGSWRSIIVADNKAAVASNAVSTRAAASVVVNGTASTATAGELVGFVTALVDLRGSLFLPPGGANSSSRAFDWRGAIGEAIFARVVGGPLGVPFGGGSQWHERRRHLREVTGPPLQPLARVFGGAFASLSGAATTDSATCLPSASPAAFALAAWSAAPTAAAGVVSVTVRFAVVCAQPTDTSAAWSGAVSIEVDQSAP